MDARLISAEKLLSTRRKAVCSDCGEDAVHSPKDSMWVIYQEILVYCPQCAVNEGLSMQQRGIS